MVRRLLIGMSFVAAGAAVVFGQGRPAAPAPAPAAPNAQLAAAKIRLYVSDETGSKVAVVDPVAGTAIDSLAVGKRPRGIKIAPDGRQLLVALSGSAIGGPGVDESKLPPPDRTADGIGVVDVTTHKVLRIVKSGDDPEAFDVSKDGRTLYVSNEDAGALSVLDLISGSVRKSVKVGEEPEGVAIRPDGKVVYVTSEGGGEVIAVDTTTMAVVGRMKTGARPRGIAFTKNSATAFITCENGGVVTVLDAQAHKVAGTITLPKPADPNAVAPRPMGIVLTADEKTLYVSLGRAKGIAVIDTATRKLTKTIENVGDRPWGIALSPDGTKLYSANGPSHDVSIIDLATGKVDKRVTVGGGPWGIAVATVK